MVNILISYFRDLVVCLEIQDHLEDLVHWYVGIDHFSNLAVVVFEGIAHGCAGSKQIKKNLRHHDGDSHENVA